MDNPRERYQHEVTQRAIEWVFAMQCRNGGWASFDKDNTKKIFESIPFADHNAMIDPPTVDITGRHSGDAGELRLDRRDARVEKAVQFMLREQESDGSWFGRWGVNYLYGTFLVLRGLQAMEYRRERAGGAAGGGVDSHGAESGWRLGRDAAGRMTIRAQRGDWAVHAVADGVGDAGTAGGGRHAFGLRGQGNSVADDAAAGGWELGRVVPRPQRRERITRGQGFRGCFTWRITCTALLPAAGVDDV